MAETVLVMPGLGPQMVERAEQLIEQIERVGVAVDSAFWHLDPEAAVWQLILICPGVRTHGAMAIYRKIQKVLRVLNSDGGVGLPFKRISALEATHPGAQVEDGPFKVYVRKPRGAGRQAKARRTRLAGSR